MEDLRDVRGRIVCLAIAAVIGIVLAALISWGIPDPDHLGRYCRTCLGRPSGRSLSLTLIEALAITLALYNVFRRIRRG